MSSTALSAAIKTFPILGRFSISRGSRTEARVIRMVLSRDGIAGARECLPYARYQKRPENRLAAIIDMNAAIASPSSRLSEHTTPSMLSRTRPAASLKHLPLRREPGNLTLAIMVGCMVSTSLFTGRRHCLRLRQNGAIATYRNGKIDRAGSSLWGFQRTVAA